MKYKSLIGYGVVAVAVASLSIGATWTYANLTATTINACVSKIGTVRILADSAPVKCFKTERLLSWNMMGPKGDTGPVGPQGPQGELGAGWDEARFTELESRVAALESTPEDSPTDPQDPPMPHDDGLYAEVVSTDANSIVRDDSKDYAEFIIKVDLTAYGSDYYVSATSTTALAFGVLDGNGVAAPGTISSARTSTASKEGDSFRINEGDTETFTLTISFTPNSVGFFRARMEQVQYGASAANPFGMSHATLPAEDYETEYVLVMD